MILPLRQHEVPMGAPRLIVQTNPLNYGKIAWQNDKEMNVNRVAQKDYVSEKVLKALKVYLTYEWNIPDSLILGKYISIICTKFWSFLIK